MFLDGALCLSHISLLGSDLILHQWESLERDGVRCQTLGESEPHLRWIYRYTSSNHPSFVLSNATTSAKKQKQITLLLYTFIGCLCDWNLQQLHPSSKAQSPTPSILLVLNWKCHWPGTLSQKNDMPRFEHLLFCHDESMLTPNVTSKVVQIDFFKQ